MSQCVSHEYNSAWSDRWPLSAFNAPFQLHLSDQLTYSLCLAAPAKKAETKVVEKVQKKRVKKDKDAPKKPMPPFFCYQKGRRENLKTEKPSADNTQLIKVSNLFRQPQAYQPSQPQLAKGRARS